MISTIKGRLLKKKDSSLLIEVGSVGYEVLVPLTVLADLKDTPFGEEVSLVTFHYYAVDVRNGTV